MRKLMLFAAVLFCAGCSVYKEYERPGLPELDGLYGAVGATDSVSLAALGWRDFFRDPELQDLISASSRQKRPWRPPGWHCCPR